MFSDTWRIPERGDILILNVLKYPNPILSQRAVPVDAVTEEIQTLVSDMLDTMYAEGGIGLAAPQVGVLKRVVVLRVPPDPEMILINPQIESRSGSIQAPEGCLSFPGQTVEVERSASIEVSALASNGETIRVRARGLLAVCLQHEIDHLDGVLFLDRLSGLRRHMLIRKMRKSSKHAASL